MLIDVHTHLTLPAFDQDRDTVMERNKNVLIIENGLYAESNLQVLELCKRYANVKAALGIYPTHAVDLAEEQFYLQLKWIKKQKNQCVAVGEIGLDLQEIESLQLQRERFIQLVELAKKMHKPVIVHSRKAEKETVETLQSLNYKKVIMHCFCGNMKLVKQIEDAGWCITIPSLVITSQHFQHVASRVNINQLLTETDAPYLNPVKEERNEPKNVMHAIKKIAEIKKLECDEVEKNIFMNAQKMLLMREK
ncbi:MAG: TatD family hydrolase [Nanoarchaeota archaeon]